MNVVITPSHAVVNVTLQQDTYTVNENIGSARVCTNLVGNLERVVTVNVSTLSATAQGLYVCSNTLYLLVYIYISSECTAGLDFSSVSPIPLIFSETIQGNVTDCVEIPIVNDTFLELDENFIVSLDTSDRAINILQNQATVTIIDNDSKCRRLILLCYVIYSISTCVHTYAVHCSGDCGSTANIL